MLMKRHRGMSACQFQGCCDKKKFHFVSGVESFPRSVAAFVLNFGRFVSVPPTDLAVIKLSPLLQRFLSSIRHFRLRASPTTPIILSIIFPCVSLSCFCQSCSQILRFFLFSPEKFFFSLFSLSLLCHVTVSIL